jgi:hypothetical protein
MRFPEYSYSEVYTFLIDKVSEKYNRSFDDILTRFTHIGLEKDVLDLYNQNPYATIFSYYKRLKEKINKVCSFLI